MLVKSSEFSPNLLRRKLKEGVTKEREEERISLTRKKDLTADTMDPDDENAECSWALHIDLQQKIICSSLAHKEPSID